MDSLRGQLNNVKIFLEQMKVVVQEANRRGAEQAAKEQVRIYTNCMCGCGVSACVGLVHVCGECMCGECMCGVSACVVSACVGLVHVCGECMCGVSACVG